MEIVMLPPCYKLSPGQEHNRDRRGKGSGSSSHTLVEIKGEYLTHLFPWYMSRDRGWAKLDAVGSTVRYEVMELCTGSVQDSNG